MDASWCRGRLDVVLSRAARTSRTTSSASAATTAVRTVAWTKRASRTSPTCRTLRSRSSRTCTKRSSRSFHSRPRHGPALTSSGPTTCTLSTTSPCTSSAERWVPCLGCCWGGALDPVCVADVSGIIPLLCAFGLCVCACRRPGAHGGVTSALQLWIHVRVVAVGGRWSAREWQDQSGRRVCQAVRPRRLL